MGGRGELVTPAAAAEMLMVSERTLRRMAARGELTTIPHGREVRYRAAELARLAEKNPALASAGQDSDPDGQADAVGTDTTATADTSAGETPATAARVDDAPHSTAGIEAASSTDNAGVSDQAEGPTDDGERRALILAVETLGEELRAAREDTRRLTDEAIAARRESGLWEGRARTLEERLRQLETLALASGEVAASNQSADHTTAESGEQVIEDRPEDQPFFARLLARWRRK